MLKKEKMDTLFEKLNLQKLKASDWKFIEEYCLLMKPLATSLDMLQAESGDISLGYVLPTIYALKQRLERFTYLSANGIILREVILFGIQKRFSFLFIFTCIYY